MYNKLILFIVLAWIYKHYYMAWKRRVINTDGAMLNKNR